MSKLIKKNRSPRKRVALIHEHIDMELKDLFRDASVEKHVSCKKGCTACCYTQVSVTEDEALVLAEKVKKSVRIDFDLLERQAIIGDDPKQWYQLSHEDRRCVFLDDSGSCKVYESRPSVCRTNYVVSDPKYCSTKEGKPQPVNLLKTYRADMVIAAQYTQSKRNGALPSMLVSALSSALAILKSKDLR